jgi:hypothetical protein
METIPDLYLEFLEFSLLSYVKPIEKYLAFEPRTRTKSQIYSHGKLTVEMRKSRNSARKQNFKRKLIIP